MLRERILHVAEKEGFEPSRQLSHPTPLAGEPLRPLGYFSMPVQFWRRERDSNPRCLSTSLVFKTSALNRSAISPRMKTARFLIAECAAVVNDFLQKDGRRSQYQRRETKHGAAPFGAAICAESSTASKAAADRWTRLQAASSILRVCTTREQWFGFAWLHGAKQKISV